VVDAGALHFAVGEILIEAAQQVPTAAVLFDNEACGQCPSCGRQHQLPLFGSGEKSNATEFCNVDAAVAVAGKLRLLVEIEESGLLPTKICGKFLTSALSTHLIHDCHGTVSMEPPLCFVQILCGKRLQPASSKKQQGVNLGKAISGLLPLKNSPVTQYHLRYYTEKDLLPEGRDRLALVQLFLDALRASPATASNLLRP
jgi:hypothetical protein